MTYRGVNALLGGQAVPPDGFRLVLRRTPTGGVHDPEGELGGGVALLGGQAEPPDGFRLVLRHALTGGVPDPEGELGGGVTLLSGQAEPPGGFRVILRHAPTGGVHESEVELGAGVTLLGGQAEPPGGFRVVLRHALTGGVPDPEGELGGGVTLFSRAPCRFEILGTGWRNREQKPGGHTRQYPAHLQRADSFQHRPERPIPNLGPFHGVVARIVTGPHDADRQDPHLPMRYDAGRPRAVIRFKISQPRTTSLPCPAGLRARRPSPIMDL